MVSEYGQRKKKKKERKGSKGKLAFWGRGGDGSVTRDVVPREDQACRCKDCQNRRGHTGCLGNWPKQQVKVREGLGCGLWGPRSQGA